MHAFCILPIIIPSHKKYNLITIFPHSHILFINIHADALSFSLPRSLSLTHSLSPPFPYTYTTHHIHSGVLNIYLCISFIGDACAGFFRITFSTVHKNIYLFFLLHVRNTYKCVLGTCTSVLIHHAVACSQDDWK